MPIVRQIIGPPGTGKTRRAIEVLSDLLTDGHQPNQVALVSFTKAAIREVHERVERKIGVDLSPRNGGKVSTLHSLCYWGLDIGAKGGIFDKGDWRVFCREQNIDTSAEGGYENDAFEPWEPNGDAEGDVFLAWYDWTRNNCFGLEEAANRYQPGYGIDFRRSHMLHLASLYEQAKATAGKPDFCDLLTLALGQRLSLGVRALLVDEAQDLSVLQRQVVEQWAAEADRVWYFDDPDQCIYTWAGANPQWLLDLRCEREFMAQSWRVPRRVANMANLYIARNQGRFHHQFLPRDFEGSVFWGQDMARVVADIEGNHHQTWGLLARNRYLLAKYTQALLEAGIPYQNLRGRSPMNRIPPGVLAALRLASSGPITLRDLAALAKLTPVKDFWVRGAKAELERAATSDPDYVVTFKNLANLGALPALQNALRRTETALTPLTKLTAELQSFYDQVVEKRGLEGLAGKAQVTVGTIHSAKGREWDNVVMLPDWARRTADGNDEDPEAERRVWYVGMTRARMTLSILEPVGRFFNEEVV